MQLKKIERRVKTLQRQLQQIGDMRPGSLHQPRTVCGRAGCRCQDPQNPQRHGPYDQLSDVHQGKSTTQFIPQTLVPLVARQLKNYKRFKALTSEWVDLALTLARERLAQEKQRLKTAAKSRRGDGSQK
jgi:hypothetical protein